MEGYKRCVMLFRCSLQSRENNSNNFYNDEQLFR